MQNDIGPQKGPSSVPRIEAQVKSVEREIEISDCAQCRHCYGSALFNDYFCSLHGKYYPTPCEDFASVVVDELRSF